MRKILITLGVLSAALLGVVGLAACGEQSEHTVHTWDEGKVTLAATCGQDGILTYTCTECGEIRTEPITARPAHTPVVVSAKAPTCTEGGYDEGISCEVCGAILDEREPLAPLGHDWEGWTEITPATCSLEGEESNTCERCLLTETREISKLPHTPVPVEKLEATCIAVGHEAGTVCDICGEVLSGLEEIPLADHSWGSWSTVIDATCANEGLLRSDCSVCGASETQATPRLAHTPVTVFGYAADCENAGLTDGVQCSECSLWLTPQKKIAALGHLLGNWQHVESTAVMTDGGESSHERACSRLGCAYRIVNSCAFDEVAVAATCTDAAYHTHTCKTCSYSYTHEVEGQGPLGHDFEHGRYVYDAASNSHYKLCARNETHTDEPANCNYDETTVNPTCIANGLKVYTCDVCGGVKTEVIDSTPEGHKWVYGTMIQSSGVYRHSRQCSICHVRETQNCSIEYHTVDPDCTHTGKTTVTCTVCQNSETVRTAAALGHEWSEWTHTTELENHLGQNYHVRTCSRCSVKEDGACVMVEADKLPTCTSAGQDITACETCHYTELGDEIPQLFHSFGDWKKGGDGTHYRVCSRCNERETESCADHYEIVTVDRTCTQAGSRTYTCLVCGYKKVEKLGDAYGTGHSYVYTETENGHTAVCSVCRAQLAETKHAYTDSNLCICGHDGLVYREYGGTWYVYSDDNVPGVRNIVIPAVHEGKYVTRIASSAFEGNRSIETVVLPYTLVEIGQYAFRGCDRLVSVSFSEEAVSVDGQDAVVALPRLAGIASYAFENCKLLSSFTFPESLNEIGTAAFRNCTNLLTVLLPATVSEFGEDAFTGTAYYNDRTNWVNGGLYINKNLLRVDNDTLAKLGGEFTVMSDTVTIAAGAFEGCTNLVMLILPVSVVESNYYAFTGCTGLDLVEYGGGVEDWFSINFFNDDSNPMTYADSLHLNNVEEHVRIPETATRIPNGTFRGSDTVVSITIPETVTYIGAYAFYGCENLVKVEIPDTVTYIGVHAFDETALVKGLGTDDHYEGGLLYVGHHLIKANEEVSTSVTLKPGTLTIAPYAFAGCTGLEEITMSDELTFIGAYAFKGCTSLKTATFTRSDGYWLAWTESVARSIDDKTLLADPARNVSEYFAAYMREWKHAKYTA